MPPLLEVEGLQVHFPLAAGWRAPGRVVQAVSGVSLTLRPDEIVAVVGESGCGKSTLARAILGLVAPTAGRIRFQGADIAGRSAAALKAYRRQLQMVFQDPFDSLNPRKTIYQTLAQPLRIHRIVPARELRAEAARLLDAVGLSPGATFLDRFAHQFSGGQRQRICIARALAVRPSVIVADEAVSALDISIRAQILKLMKQLQRELGLSYLFITHDLGVVRSLADRVLVMYLGQIVEEAPTDMLFEAPKHPYTAALLASCPVPDPVLARRRAAHTIEGDVPSPVDPPAGCRFHTRCPMVREMCRSNPPELAAIGPERRSRCHFAEEVVGPFAPAAVSA